jgi:hypothetical protein
VGIFGRKNKDGGGAAAAAGNTVDALAPVAGIDLERFAELAVKMKDCGEDPGAWARIAEENGVDRATWEEAHRGWTARMNDPATAGAIAVAYHPIYQAALTKWGGPPATATFEEYVEMSAMIRIDVEDPSPRPTDLPAMYARFSISPSDWSQISTHWTTELNRSAELSKEFMEKLKARIAEMDALHATSAGGAA